MPFTGETPVPHLNEPTRRESISEAEPLHRCSVALGARTHGLKSNERTTRSVSTRRRRSGMDAIEFQNRLIAAHEIDLGLIGNFHFCKVSQG